MAKLYGLRFGTTKASNFTGLTPTFTIFSSLGLTAMTPPGVTELPAGSGLYQFSYSPSLTIFFECDGGSILATTDRYLYGTLDPIQAVDEKVGTINDSYGSTNVDPTTLFGHAKRRQEFDEGNANFNKTTAVWSIYSRGSTTLLATKNLTNDSSAATKT